MIIEASAPGRAGIIGNPTDMYGGSVISCSVENRSYCRISESDSLVISVGGICREISETDHLNHDGNVLDVVKAALRYFEIDPCSAGFSLAAWTDIPEQAGLGGSSSIITSVAGCLSAYLNLQFNDYEFSEMIHKIEANEMKVVCGYQDMYMSVFGGINYMDFRGKEGMTQNPGEPFATIEPLSGFVGGELPIVVAYSGVMHSSSSVHHGLRGRWFLGERKVVDGYKKIGELARFGKRALIEKDWQELASLMNENHEIQRELGGSGEANEALIKVALDNGALGAKLAGAGGGGTIIALTEDPEGLSKTLLESGADEIIHLLPSDGLIVEKTA